MAMVTAICVVIVLAAGVLAGCSKKSPASATPGATAQGGTGVTPEMAQQKKMGQMSHK